MCHILALRLLFGSKPSWASVEYWINFTERFGGVHAFGYNSAKSAQIWMKSGALRLHFGGLAVADFGCDPCSSGSLRGRQKFFVW